MKKLNHKLQATSLIETIVSSIIFMLVFIIAMHSMSNIIAYDNKQGNYLIIDNDIKRCRRLIETEGIDITIPKQYQSFPWGKINIEVYPYKGNIFLIHMNSEVRSGQSIKYQFLYAHQ